MSTITTRSGKGSPLSNAELDANFTALNADKLEDITGESIKDLSDVHDSFVPTEGQVLTYTVADGWTAANAGGVGALSAEEAIAYAIALG